MSGSHLPQPPPALQGIQFTQAEFRRRQTERLRDQLNTINHEFISKSAPSEDGDKTPRCQRSGLAHVGTLTNQPRSSESTEDVDRTPQPRRPGPGGSDKTSLRKRPRAWTEDGLVARQLKRPESADVSDKLPPTKRPGPAGWVQPPQRQRLASAGDSDQSREPPRTGRSQSTRQRSSHSQSPPRGSRGLRLLRAFSLQDKLDKHKEKSREKRRARNLSSGSATDSSMKHGQMSPTNYPTTPDRNMSQGGTPDPAASNSANKHSKRESYKAQKRTYRSQKKEAAKELLSTITDPAVVLLGDWLKVRGTLKSWTKLWCVLKPGVLVLYKSDKHRGSQWVGTILLNTCQLLERPSKKDGFCFKLFHPLDQSIWATKGPKGETIGAFVQPLPYSYCIFRAPSESAGKCWMDALELALKCTNLLKRSMTRLDNTVDTPTDHDLDRSRHQDTSWRVPTQGEDYHSSQNGGDHLHDGESETFGHTYNSMRAQERNMNDSDLERHFANQDATEPDCDTDASNWSEGSDWGLVKRKELGTVRDIVKITDRTKELQKGQASKEPSNKHEKASCSSVGRARGDKSRVDWDTPVFIHQNSKPPGELQPTDRKTPDLPLPKAQPKGMPLKEQTKPLETVPQVNNQKRESYALDGKSQTLPSKRSRCELPLVACENIAETNARTGSPGSRPASVRLAGLRADQRKAAGVPQVGDMSKGQQKICPRFVKPRRFGSSVDEASQTLFHGENCGVCSSTLESSIQNCSSSSALLVFTSCPLPSHSDLEEASSGMDGRSSQYLSEVCSDSVRFYRSDWKPGASSSCDGDISHTCSTIGSTGQSRLETCSRKRPGTSSSTVARDLKSGSSTVDWSSDQTHSGSRSSGDKLGSKFHSKVKTHFHKETQGSTPTSSDRKTKARTQFHEESHICSSSLASSRAKAKNPFQEGNESSSIPILQPACRQSRFKEIHGKRNQSRSIQMEDSTDPEVQPGNVVRGQINMMTCTSSSPRVSAEKKATPKGMASEKVKESQTQTWKDATLPMKTNSLSPWVTMGPTDTETEISQTTIWSVSSDPQTSQLTLGSRVTETETSLTSNSMETETSRTITESTKAETSVDQSTVGTTETQTSDTSVDATAVETQTSCTTMWTTDTDTTARSGYGSTSGTAPGMMMDATCGSSQDRSGGSRQSDTESGQTNLKESSTNSTVLRTRRSTGFCSHSDPNAVSPDSSFTSLDMSEVSHFSQVGSSVDLNESATSVDHNESARESCSFYSRSLSRASTYDSSISSGSSRFYRHRGGAQSSARYKSKAEKGEKKKKKKKDKGEEESSAGPEDSADADSGDKKKKKKKKKDKEGDEKSGGDPEESGADSGDKKKKKKKKDKGGDEKGEETSAAGEESTADSGDKKKKKKKKKDKGGDEKGEETPAAGEESGADSGDKKKKKKKKKDKGGDEKGEETPAAGEESTADSGDKKKKKKKKKGKGGDEKEKDKDEKGEETPAAGEESTADSGDKKKKKKKKKDKGGDEKEKGGDEKGEETPAAGEESTADSGDKKKKKKKKKDKGGEKGEEPSAAGEESGADSGDKKKKKKKDKKGEKEEGGEGEEGGKKKKKKKGKDKEGETAEGEKGEDKEGGKKKKKKKDKGEKGKDEEGGKKKKKDKKKKDDEGEKSGEGEAEKEQKDVEEKGEDAGEGEQEQKDEEGDEKEQSKEEQVATDVTTEDTTADSAIDAVSVQDSEVDLPITEPSASAPSEAPVQQAEVADVEKLVKMESIVDVMMSGMHVTEEKPPQEGETVEGEISTTDVSVTEGSASTEEVAGSISAVSVSSRASSEGSDESLVSSQPTVECSMPEEIVAGTTSATTYTTSEASSVSAPTPSDSAPSLSASAPTPSDFAPSPSDFAPPPSTSTPPPSVSPPSSAVSPPPGAAFSHPSHFAPPPSHFVPPPSTYTPPPSTYTPPPSTYTLPPSVYPPSSAVSPPPGAAFPPPSHFAPPPGAAFSPHSHFAPPPSTSTPPPSVSPSSSAISTSPGAAFPPPSASFSPSGASTPPGKEESFTRSRITSTSENEDAVFDMPFLAEGDYWKPGAKIDYTQGPKVDDFQVQPELSQLCPKCLAALKKQDKPLFVSQRYKITPVEDAKYIYHSPEAPGMVMADGGPGFSLAPLQQPAAAPPSEQAPGLAGAAGGSLPHSAAFGASQPPVERKSEPVEAIPGRAPSLGASQPPVLGKSEPVEAIPGRAPSLEASQPPVVGKSEPVEAIPGRAPSLEASQPPVAGKSEPLGAESGKKRSSEATVTSPASPMQLPTDLGKLGVVMASPQPSSGLDDDKSDREDYSESSQSEFEEDAGLPSRMVIAPPEETSYVMNNKEELGQSGDDCQTEEVTDENKGLIWTLVKQVRPGMDLSKVVLPTFILEPRSFLDKLSDYYYHADILSGAVLEESPYSRMKSVVRWYLSGFYKKPKGLKKPYNPVIGETFRCCWHHPATGSRTFYIAEQVSHHPPISVFHVTNRKDGFNISGSILARSKFYGNSLSAILDGVATLSFLERGEDYFITMPYAHCKGILIGTLTMELGGKVTINCPKTGYKCELEFKLKPFLGSGQASNRIHGKITMGSDVLAMIDGHWDQEIYIKDRALDKKREVFWTPTPEIRAGRLKRHTVPLADQCPYESEKLWEAVSKAVVTSDMQAATNEKYIIEEEQRKSARERKVNKTEWMPRYFEKDYLTGGEWIYKHADDRPWDPVNDVYQYEKGFVIQTQTRHKTPHLRATSLSSLNKSVEKKKLHIPLTVEESDSSGHGLHRESDSSDYVGRRGGSLGAGGGGSGKVVKLTQEGLSLLFDPLVKMQEETTQALRSLQQQVLRMEMQHANSAGGGGGQGLLSKDWVTLAIILIFQIILQWIFR